MKILKVFVVSIIVIGSVMYFLSKREPKIIRTASQLKQDSINYRKSQIIPGKVTNVKDGDSFDFVFAYNARATIQLAGIDCPEYNQRFGREAKELTKKLCLGKEIKVEIVSHDTKYFRIVCMAYLSDGTCINHELLKNGYAWHYKKYSSDQKLADLENHARLNKVGLWSDPAPVAPWDFRHNH